MVAPGDGVRKWVDESLTCEKQGGDSRGNLRELGFPRLNRRGLFRNIGLRIDWGGLCLGLSRGSHLRCHCLGLAHGQCGGSIAGSEFSKSHSKSGNGEPEGWGCPDLARQSAAPRRRSRHIYEG